MMRSNFITLLMTLVMSVGVSADEQKDVEQIVALFGKWRQAVNTADIPLYTTVLHENVRLIPPGAEPIAGKSAYADFLVPVFASATYEIEVVAHPAVTVIDDIAVAEYEYVIHLSLKDSEQGITTEGALTASRTQARYFDVLRKSDDGDWLVWRHTWQNR